MKKLILGLMITIFSCASYADAAKGQQDYLDYLRPLFGYNGQDFASQHLKVEWKRYFKKDAKKFIKTYSKKHPDSAEFLSSEKFQEIAPDVRDFAMKYAADSGELAACD
ncbi:hypothetical protein MACH09_15880 [Vibrio sp. MACH09]|uniref:hypothetical protein n=1 Tax=unclassified Vibrio TaxID=2614977 RepID=UPI001493DABD|nr:MULTISPECIES: hypothetical protein [unclassified Vibrio]NOI67932.1 hypothetical protein [Vibrio sp. 99-8-1]GLO61080.1 hypothetical protein MACH09_15880 [Vibrio sp. MACH09]